eukprot:GHVR01170625.1.p1 GENE.GHVR01170625.1~~GHVR01170625.1.p1  ORF type:complete len:108 (+),score=2.93 GHVR01170625.1:132-455(+)
MELLRGVVRQCEYSSRVLLLTEEAISRNSANYSVWQYRRNCLLYINADLMDERKYVELWIERSPKNYQIKSDHLMVNSSQVRGRFYRTERILTPGHTVCMCVISLVS